MELVTHHFSAKNGTNQPKQAPSAPKVFPWFCDWLSITQHHGEGLPKVNDGQIVRFDENDEVVYIAEKTKRLIGSHDSSIHIRCDGHTVSFHGNVSKFCRKDNVFGYSFDECIKRINQILANSFGLPPFTAGESWVVVDDDGRLSTQWTGARIQRLDVTQNFAAGSADNAAAFMRHLASQQASRLKTGTHGEGETVDFGRGSKRIYSKAYLKGPELRKHAKRIPNPENLNLPMVDSYVLDLADWCDSVGLVRFETTYKSTYLISNNLQFLGSIDMNVIHADFQKRQEVFTRAKLDIDDLADLAPKELAVYRMWQAGDHLSTKMTRRTFYRHRARLLPFGIDIAIPSNIAKFEPKTRVITLGPVQPPAFYERPHFSHLALVA